MYHLLLGSKSPRRKDILNFFNIPFTTAIPTFDENSIKFDDNPTDYVCQISKGKALSLKPIYPKSCILTADSIVYLEGKVFGKPKDLEEANLMLQRLSGRWHSVFTGITIITANQEFHMAEETKVLFNPLTTEQIKIYHNKLPCLDKAGAYGAQMGAGLIINKIDGCFYNVMGLPINTLRLLFNKIGIDLWDHIRK